MAENVLHIENMTMQFGGVVAVNNLNLDVNEGEIVALIGPNGAGKTTAFNVISGIYEPSNGRIDFYGETIVENYPQGKMRKLYAGENNGKYTKAIAPSADSITKKGIARTFQNIRLFSNLTVFENVLIAKLFHRTSLTESLGKTDKRTLHQRSFLGDTTAQKLFHLLIETGILKGITCQLIFQKTVDDLLGKNNRIQSHDFYSS